MEQFKHAASIEYIIAVMSGILSLVYTLLRLAMMYINSKQLEAKAIRACYFDVDASKFT